MPRLDLNLLVAFDALMRERSVSKAAARLGLGQPAMSAALGRLRVLFGDTLFVRTPIGMAPTQRAQDIARPVAQALEQLRGTLETAAVFEPERAQRVFTLSGGDYLAMVVLPGLVASVLRQAPGIDLRFRFVEKDLTLSLLDDGRIDLAAAVLPDVPKHFATEPLLTDSFVCLTRVGHPACAAGLTLERFVATPHILVTERGDAIGAVDEALGARGLSRRIALTVPQVAMLPMLLTATDLIATAGRRAADRLSSVAALAVHEPPIALRPWRLDLIWSRRNEGDPGLMWLRDRVRETTGTS